MLIAAARLANQQEIPARPAQLPDPVHLAQPGRDQAARRAWSGRVTWEQVDVHLVAAQLDWRQARGVVQPALVEPAEHLPDAVDGLVRVGELVGPPGALFLDVERLEL